MAENPLSLSWQREANEAGLVLVASRDCRTVREWWSGMLESLHLLLRSLEYSPCEWQQHARLGASHEDVSPSVAPSDMHTLFCSPLLGYKPYDLLLTREVSLVFRETSLTKRLSSVLLDLFCIWIPHYEKCKILYCGQTDGEYHVMELISAANSNISQLERECSPAKTWNNRILWVGGGEP